MNILIFLQQSVYTNEGKWTTADSNIQMHLGLIRNVLKIREDVNFYVVISPFEDFYGGISLKDDLIDDPRVVFITRPVPVNAFYGRIHFDISWFEKVMTVDFLKKIHVIINNEPCLTRNIKTYLHFKNVSIPIVTQNFWMDCPTINEEKIDKNISYDWRQMDGVECSELAAFTCESTGYAFHVNCRNRLLGNVVRNQTIWDMGFDADELLKKSYPKFDRKTILFPNRMSSINYTHHLEFIEAIKLLSKMRDDFDVVFCNPSGKIEWQWLKDNVPNLRVLTEKILTRAEYIELLWRSHVGVSLYTIERYGGCANVEMLFCGMKVVMPCVFEYDLRGGRDYPFFISDSIIPTGIANRLNEALDSDYDMSSVSKRVYDMSSYQVVAQKVMSDLDELVKRHNAQ